MTDRLDDHGGRDPETLHAELGVQLDQAAKEVVRRMADGVGYEAAHQAWRSLTSGLPATPRCTTSCPSSRRAPYRTPLSKATSTEPPATAFKLHFGQTPTEYARRFL